MPAPPVFSRAPRLYPKLPTGEVEIPAAPAAPNAPSASLTTVLLPLAGTVVAIGISVGVSMFSRSGTTMLTAMLISVPMMLVTYVVSFYNYSSQKKGYRQALADRESRYTAVLGTIRRDLAARREEARSALNANDPDPAQCLDRARRLDHRLWERAPQDGDFLSLRLGLGVQPFSVTVRAPKPRDAFDTDPLLQAAQATAAEYGSVDGVPVRLALTSGPVGLVGPRPAVRALARALAVQLATLHSPDEVKLAALFPAGEEGDWAWLRWLPHVWTEDRNHRLLACRKDMAHNLLAGLETQLSGRRLQKNGSGPALVVILADPNLAENEPAIPLLLSPDPAMRAYPLFLADRIDGLPQGCSVIVDLSNQQGRLIRTATGTEAPFVPDLVGPDLADSFSRSLAPVQLQRLSSSGRIPDLVPLLDLLGARTVEELDVAGLWAASEPFTSLAAPIGRRAGGDLRWLDLHENRHGPHGLMAGCTGSGKSELLQTLVASLAVRFHPHEVAFVLIDYKGGGMAHAFRDLPHLIGTITNLDGTLANRALAALKSEMARREVLVGGKDIYDYQRKHRQQRVKEPLPHLVLIVDEFAELAKAQPDFISGLVSAATVGRSLGVHLILATQKPAGVVNDHIWTNSRFRICLRVERPGDSMEVLKQPDAARITQKGRGYLQVGDNEVFDPFQSGWAGAPYVPAAGAAPEQSVMEVALDGTRHALRLSPNPVVIQSPEAQLQAVVRHLSMTARQQGIERLQGPWLPPLPTQVTLPVSPSAEGWDGHDWRPTTPWLAPVIGLVDDPARQGQGPLAIDLGKEGHLVVYGGPGAGKTTFLRTMAIALAHSHPPADVNLYVLDFGGRLLTGLAALPHVGGVIVNDEEERLTRLLRFLLRELDRRKVLFASAGVGTLPAYRSETGDSLPAIVLMLDNYTGFMTQYPAAEDQLAQVVREGGNLGLHVVMTAGGPNTVRAKIGGYMGMAVALQMVEPGDYSLAVGRTDGLLPARERGRGLVKSVPPREFQTALPAPGKGEAERTSALRRLIGEMAAASKGPRAAPVPTLPDVVALAQLILPGKAPAPPDGNSSLAVPIALDVDDLTPVTVDLQDGPHFVISGGAQSGKTTLLQSWLLALAERFAPDRVRFCLIDFQRSGLVALQNLPHLQALVDDSRTLDAALDGIEQQLRERRQALGEARRTAAGSLEERAFIAQYPALVIAIDDADAFRSQSSLEARARLEQIVRRERGMGVHVLFSGSVAEVSNIFEGLAKSLKELQMAVLLGTNDSGDLSQFSVRLSIEEMARFLPPGTGYLLQRGKRRAIRVATAQAGQPGLAAWVEQIRCRPSTIMGGRS